MKFLLYRCPLVWTVGRNQKDRWELIQKKSQVALLSSSCGYDHLGCERKWLGVPFSGGKQGQRYEGKKRVPPQRKSVKGVHRYLYSSLKSGHRCVILVLAMPTAYDGKPQREVGSFLAHCSTSLLPRISLGHGGSRVNPYKPFVLSQRSVEWKCDNPCSSVVQ